MNRAGSRGVSRLVCLHRFCSLAAVTVPALRSACLRYAESQITDAWRPDHQILKIDCGDQGRRGGRTGRVFVDPWPGHDVAERAWAHAVGEVKSGKAKTEIEDFSGEGGLCDHLCCPLLSSPLLPSPLLVFLAFCAALSKGLPQGFGQTSSCCQSRSPSPRSLCLPVHVHLSLWALLVWSAACQAQKLPVGGERRM